MYMYTHVARVVRALKQKKNVAENTACPGGTEPGGRPCFFKWKIINGPPHHVVFVSFFFF